MRKQMTTKMWVCSAVAMLIAATCVGTVGAEANTEPNKSTPNAKGNRTKNKVTGVRTLDEINIEGEIAVPQVLFITSRDYPRYRDGLGRKYRKNSLAVARSMSPPTRLRIVALLEQTKEDGQ